MYLLKVKIEGVTPILFNRFNEADLVGTTKTRPKANTEESEREAALKTAHIDENGELFLPFEMLFSCIMAAGKFEKLGKSKITTIKSSLVPAGVSIVEKRIPFNTKDFEVDRRPVVNPNTGGAIMKFRAKLEDWSLSFTLEVDETLFSTHVVRVLLDHAGSKIGLGSFRPSCKGLFGKFKVVEFEKQ